MFRNFRISDNATPSILRKNFFRSHALTIVWAENCFENGELAFLDKSRFRVIEYCKARITVLALPIRVFSSSSCLPFRYPNILQLLFH